MAKVASGAIQIQGLYEFKAAIAAVDEGIKGAVRIALNEAVAVVVNAAKGKTPVKTGAARASIKASSTANYARISGGGSGVPYFGFLDYGNRVHGGRGKVGKWDQVPRPFDPEGRILYPAFRQERTETISLVNQSLVDLARKHGLEVTTNGI